MRVKRTAFLLGAGLVTVMQGMAWASEGGEHHGLNWTDFAYRLVAFVFLVGILTKLLKGPITTFLASRKEEIKNLLAELEVKQAEAEKKSVVYREKLASLEQETKQIVDELIAEGEAERGKILEIARKQADYIREQAQVAVQQEIKAAREKLQEEVAEMSVAAAEEILRKNMQAEDQDRLVGDFIKRVVEAK